MIIRAVLVGTFILFGVAVCAASFRVEDFQPEEMVAVQEWAKRGDAVAQFTLATMYCYGAGVPKNYREAAKWFSLAAEQGQIYAQHDLGFMYSYGEDGRQDCREVMRLLRLGAEQGRASAQ